MKRPKRTLQTKRQGFVLVVVLLFLVVLSLLGTSAVRSARYQEQIAGAQYERVTALSASHAALSDGRDYVLQPEFDANDPGYRVRDLASAGVIGTVDEGWNVASWILGNTDWQSGPFAHPFGVGNGESYQIARVNRQPSFIVDKLPAEQTQNAVPYMTYRVTARGEGGHSDNAAYTQSILRVPVPH